jgi:hypothetical protein
MAKVAMAKERMLNVGVEENVAQTSKERGGRGPGLMITCHSSNPKLILFLSFPTHSAHLRDVQYWYARRIPETKHPDQY